MRHLLIILLLCLSPCVQAGEEASTGASPQVHAAFDAHQAFVTKYADYLRAESQTPLPLPAIAKADWPALAARLKLTRVFVEPDRYYLAKLFTLTCYQAEDGRYFLDVKGGFWGMDQLYYGPFSEADLK